MGWQAAVPLSQRSLQQTGNGGPEIDAELRKARLDCRDVCVELLDRPGELEPQTRTYRSNQQPVVDDATRRFSNRT